MHQKMNNAIMVALANVCVQNTEVKLFWFLSMYALVIEPTQQETGAIMVLAWMLSKRIMHSEHESYIIMAWAWKL